MRKILLDILILVVIVSTIVYVYRTFGEQIGTVIFGEQQATMYLESTPLSVSIADESAEHTLGLSGRSELGEFEGMLFVFPVEDKYGMWMRDMLIPIDIIWINNDFRVVHIEENVSPDTYPESFSSEDPARFVLEVNAFFTQSANVIVGDQVTFPPSAIPKDLIKILQ
jgi:uncharacterized membrane protein (UPF0127 family)